MPSRRARAANMLNQTDVDTRRKSAFGHDSGAHGPAFAFRSRSGRVDWAALSIVDVDRIAQQGDLDALQSVLDNVSYADLASEGVRTAADAQLIKFGRVAQLGLEYLLHVQDVLASALQDAQLGTSSQAYTSLDRRYRRLEARHASVQEQLRAAESELLNSRRDRSRLLWICAQKSSGQAKAHWCRLCTKVFDTKSSLQSHAARRHFEQQALACGECDEQIGPADTVAANVAANASSIAIMDAKMLEAVSQLRAEFEANLSAQRQELEESKLRERALRAQIIEYGKAAEEARVQQRRQPQVVEMPNVEHIQQLATATASAVAAREVLKMDPRQLVQDLKDELVSSFTHKMTQLESQSGSSNDATIAAMRASMQRERESTVSEVKEMMQQLQQQLQQHYDENISRLSAAAAAREAELVAEANIAKQLAAEAAAAAAAAEKTAFAAAAAAAAASASDRAAAPSAVVLTNIEQQQPLVISAQSLRDVSSSSAPASPESISSFDEGAAAVVQLPRRVLQDDEPPVVAAAAFAPVHLSSASELEDISDDEPSAFVPQEVKAAPSVTAEPDSELAQETFVVAASAAQAGAAPPDSPSISSGSSSSSSSSAHTSVTASPDEVKPSRAGTVMTTPPQPVRSAQAKLNIDDVLPMQTLTMPQGYTGSPIMSRVFIAVEEIQEQLQQVETFLSRKHTQTATKPAPSVTAASSAASAAHNQPAVATGSAARLPSAATSAALAQDAVSELQRRREQQQKQSSIQHSLVDSSAKLDAGSTQAVKMRALLLRSDGNDSDSGDDAQPLRSAPYGTRQQQQQSGEPLILAPVHRSALRAGASTSKAGSGALVSDSDSDDGTGVVLALQRKSGVPSSPVAKASLSVAASRRSAAASASNAQAQTSSSSGETDESSESDYEEDFDAESGSSSSRQQPVKVQVVRQKPSAAPPPVFVSNSSKPVQKVGNLVDREDLIGSDESNSDNEVMAFGGRDLSKVMQQSSSTTGTSQQQLYAPSASRAPAPQAAPAVGVWAADDISDVEELV